WTSCFSCSCSRSNRAASSGGNAHERMGETARMKLPVGKLITFLVPLIALALVPVVVHTDYLMQVFFRIVLFAALGLAWNLVGGYAGQLSLGHVAFFGVGAYGLAMFTARGVPVWISIFLAAAVATGFAANIGLIVFRLRGPYFTLSTIAFA